jgi:hypothetical protein
MLNIAIVSMTHDVTSACWHSGIEHAQSVTVTVHLPDAQ